MKKKSGCTQEITWKVKEREKKKKKNIFKPVDASLTCTLQYKRYILVDDDLVESVIV